MSCGKDEKSFDVHFFHEYSIQYILVIIIVSSRHMSRYIIDKQILNLDALYM